MQSIFTQTSKEVINQAIASLNLAPRGQFRYSEALTIAQLSEDPRLAIDEATLPLNQEARAMLSYVKAQLHRRDEFPYSLVFLLKVARERMKKAAERRSLSAKNWFAYCLYEAMGIALRDGLSEIPMGF